MQSDYQRNFSELYPAAAVDRERKARTVLAVLADHLGAGRLRGLRVLDVGASTGAVDAWLAPHVAEVVGLDIDRAAIEQARRDWQRPNLRFEHADALALPFPSGAFDVVLCMHVYEHVPDAPRLLAEIGRVLKPGGVCYFAAGNRFQLMEPHHRLPLLSVVPKALAHGYLRLLGRGRHYYERHLSLGGLRRLVRAFTAHDYTARMLREPERFAIDYLFAGAAWKRPVARAVATFAYALFPTYIWLLEKPRDGSPLTPAR